MTNNRKIELLEEYSQLQKEIIVGFSDALNMLADNNLIKQDKRKNSITDALSEIVDKNAEISKKAIQLESELASLKDEGVTDDIIKKYAWNKYTEAGSIIFFTDGAKWMRDKLSADADYEIV